jgi:predicted transposase/invertase (TIGR01784 family)
MVQVAEKLSILKMTPEERANYSYYQKKLYSDRDELAAAEARGEAKGKAEEKIEIARKMLAKGTSSDEIVELTDLSKEQIEKLKSS